MNFRTADTSAGRLAHLTGDERETVKITALQLNLVASGPARAALIGACSVLYPMRSDSYHNAIPSFWSSHGPNVRPFHLRAG